MTTLKEYTRFDALGLAELVRKKQVSSQELLATAIDLAEQWNPHLNAVIHKMYDEAALTLERLPADAPFKGVPFLIKDLGLLYKGQPSTYCSRYMKDFIAPEDSELMIRYRKAGLVTFGKTNSPEFGIYGVTEPELFGPTKNPYDLGYSPGGSSGGAAAAVAARIVPVAQAGDGGGSIRIPASACGLVGLKPSRARMPIGPMVAESWMGFVVEHVLSRSVRDSAALLDCTMGYDGLEPISLPLPAGKYLDYVEKDPPILKMAYHEASLFGHDTHNDCKDALQRALKQCESLGHRVEEACPKFNKQELIMAYLKTVAVSLNHDLTTIAKMTGRPLRSELFEASTWFLYQLGSKITAPELMQAQAIIRDLRASMREFFQRYDVFVTPTMAHPPPRLGLMKLKSAEKVALSALRVYPARLAMDIALHQMAETGFEQAPNTQIFNMSGYPAISLPLYWNAQNLPIGIQFGCRFGREELLFSLAAQLERVYQWQDKAPSLPGA